MAMVRATTQSVTFGRPTKGNWRVWTAAYLIVSVPLSLFLYLNTFQEATSFFGGFSGSVLVRACWLPVLGVSWLGAWMVWRMPLRRAGMWVCFWLLLGAMITTLLWEPRRDSRELAAMALCVPAWLGFPARLASLWRRADHPLGRVGLWAFNGVLVAAATILSFVANTLWICFTVPEFPTRWPARLFLAGRMALLTGGPALLLVPFLAGLAWLLGRRAAGTRLAVLLLGASGVLLFGLILFNGLSILDPHLLRPLNFAYALALAFPLSLIFCERVTAAGDSLGAGLAAFGRMRWQAESARAPALRRVFPFVWLTLLVTGQCLAGRAHRYYEWGFGTSMLYTILGIGWTWWLLTTLSRRAQAWLSGGIIAVAVLGAFSFLPAAQNPMLWAEYTKFDNNVRALVRAYYHRHPTGAPEFQLGRRLLDGSYDLGPTNLLALRRQALVAQPRGDRPYVFFIVADALRAETYDNSPAHRARYPGLEWMARHFVSYNNTWSSYNSTLGSYPAYLSGMMNPAWYQFTSDWPIRQDNLLARAATLTGYRAYCLATFDAELSRAWPTNARVALRPGGFGEGDPAVVFPQALRLLTRQQAAGPNQPALFYLHLYNLHQPLLRRPTVPLQEAGRHWMRALYEQNALYFDLHLQRFLQALQARKLLDRSIVIVTGDHGEELFDLGGLYHGWQINPWVMRVPLYVHYPKGTAGAPPPGTVSDRPVNLIDVAPTVCELMGVHIIRQSNWQGLNLLQPEPAAARSFLLLSWETPLVGRISFAPLQMLVLNLESGQEEAFVPTEHGWNMTAPPAPPTTLADSLNGSLRKLFHFWRMDPEHGKYLPATYAR